MLWARYVLVGLVTLGSLQASLGASITVFKEGSALTAGGALDSAFAAAGPASVAPQPVNDAYLTSNAAAAWSCYGAAASSGGTLLFKFDLSAIPSNATIYKAQLRLKATGGNTPGGVSRIITHDWDEAVCTLAGPDGPASPNKTWGPAANALFGSADYYGGTTTGFDSVANWWLVKDVTADVQGFVAGTFPNYGWYANSGNYSIEMSENADDGGRPALFVSYYVPGTQPPTAISDLAASRPHLHDITLTWSAPSDDTGPGNAAASYDIRYSTDTITDANFASATAVAQALVPKAPGSAETLVVSGLDPDTAYFFAIKSTDIDGMTGALSNVATGRTVAPDLTPPAAVTDLAATSVQYNQVTLTWTAPPDPDNAGAASYDLRMSTSPIGDSNFAAATAVPRSLVPQLAGAAESLLVSNLDAGTTYYFAIKAADSAQNVSSLSNVVQVTTPPDPRPLVTTVGILKEGISLSAGGVMDAVFSGAGPSDILSQTVNDTAFSGNSAAAWVNYGDSATGGYIALFKFDLSMLPPEATILKAQLRCKMVGGNTGIQIARVITHDWTEALCTQAGPNNPPGGHYSWGPASNAVFGAADHGLPVEVDSRGNYWMVEDVTSDVQAFAAGSLPNYGWACFLGNNWLELSEYSVDGERPALFIQYQFRGEIPPKTILDLATSNLQLHSLTLTWSAPNDPMNAGNPAASYDVRMSTSPINQSNWDAATPVPQTLTPQAPNQRETLMVNDLEPGLTYYFAIKSTGTSGLTSGLSNVAAGTTLPLDFIPPAPTSDLYAVEARTNLVILGWTATGDDGMVGHATAYDIHMSSNPIDESNFAAGTVLAPGLVPQAPGQAETVLVVGLAPGTDYWFAIKVVDEQNNWSSLTVVQVTTLADMTPPAAVRNLEASGAGPFSATLSWTATGNDGSVGAASRYQIRYSTAPLDETSWGTATVAANAVAPQSAGGDEQCTVCGLQPATTYYLALKVQDAAGNISGISNVASCTTAADPGLRKLETLTIVEKAGQTTDDYPVTVGLVFKKGDVTDNVTLRAAGQYLPTQTDVKVRYPDGSVKHAIVSLVLPQLQANQAVAIDVLSGGPNANARPMTVAQLLAGDFDARMTITINGVPTVISGREMLRHAASVETWLAGDVVTEFLIKNFNTNIAQQLNVQYRVRVYNGREGGRVEAVVENCWCQYRGNVTYDFTYAIGLSDPQVVLSRTGFVHNTSARWHNTAWIGSTPPAIQVQFDLPYMVATGVIPNYDTSLLVSEATRAERYSSWQKSAHDLMTSGIVTTFFGMTGGREDIGPYPMWAARYLASQFDNRMKEIMLNCADVSGYIPIHYRESDKTRSFYGRIMSIDDRPTVWSDRWDWTGIAPQDSIGAPIGDTATIWSVEPAHQPSLAYIPYMVTGEYYYCEEMMFWGGWNLANENGGAGYREGSLGIIVGQVRGWAWSVRNIADAANLAPDGTPEKVYLTQKVNNNLRWRENMYIPGYYPTMRWWGPYASTCTAVWQDDYVMFTLGHMKEMGFDSQPLVNWLGMSVVGRFTHRDELNPYRAADAGFINVPVGYLDAAGICVPYSSWAAIEAAYSTPAPTDFSSIPSVVSYAYSARGAGTYVPHLPGGNDAFNWLNTHMVNISQLNDGPCWGLLPRPALIGDADGDGAVNLADLKLLVAAWNTRWGQTGFNVGADVDADFTITLADLKILVGNWNAHLP